MKYPEEFMKKVLAEYGEWPGMCAMLKTAFVAENDTTIRKLLDGGTLSLEMQLSPQKIICAKQM